MAKTTAEYQQLSPVAGTQGGGTFDDVEKVHLNERIFFRNPPMDRNTVFRLKLTKELLLEIIVNL